MKKALFLFVLILSAWIPLSAQSLSGYVYSRSENTPLPGAEVLVKETNTGSTCDPKGYFDIKLKPGEYTLRVSYTGYRTSLRKIRLKAGEHLSLRFYLDAESQLLESVTVEAVRAAEDAPIAQRTLGKKEIEKIFRGEDAQFLLRELSPSITSHSEAGTAFSNYGAMRLRGIDQTRINITLNGAPLNDMLDQGVFFSNFTDFANSIQSVQIQRGVGFSSNGTASYAGSVNFESENIFTDRARAEVQVNAASFGTMRGSAEIFSGPLNEKFAFYGRMSSFQTEGYRYHSGSESWSMFFSAGYRGEKDLLKITAFNGRSRNELAYFPVPLPLIQNDPRSNINFEQDRDQFGQNFLQIQYSRSVSSSTSYHGSLYYGGAGGDFPFGYGDSLGNFAGQINYPLQNRHYGFFGTLHHEKEKIQIKSGVHAYLFKRKNWETLLPDNVNTIYNDRSQKSEISAFVNARYILSKRFSLFGDVQLRESTMKFEADPRILPATVNIPPYQYFFINPKAGMNYKFGKNTLAYFSFGRTGREPTKFDIFGGSTRLDSSNLAAVQKQNLILPEYVNDFEAGFRYRRERLKLNVNFFWMDFRNKIEPIGERLIWVQLRKNVPRSYRRGIEAEGSWESPGGFYSDGFISLMDARIKAYDPDNDDLDLVYHNVRPALTPPLLLQLRAGRKFLRQFDFSLAGRYTAAMYIEPTNRADWTVPASFVLNARLLYSPSERVEVSIQARNLLNALYYNYGEIAYYEGNMLPAYFVEAPRNFNILLRFAF